MKKLFLSILLLVPVAGFASGGIPLDKADVDLNNKASLQRGFKYFANYCLSCHAASYSRYNRVGRDLGISDEQLVDNIIFTRDAKGEKDKVGALMKVAMTPAYAKTAFGTNPPDLTVVARSRGADWIYTYLRGFYLDPSRPFGVNNVAFPEVGMPHVLWELQGWQAKVEPAHHGEEEGGHGAHGKPELKLVKAGSQTPAEYDRTVRDIVNFLVYLGEPAQQARKQYGLYVLLFLFVLFIPAYFLKKEYWKDVH
ncbi:MAG: cytochrome c1 [bacterium]